MDAFIVEAKYIKYKFIRRVSHMIHDIARAIRGQSVIRFDYDPIKTYLYVLDTPYLSPENEKKLQSQFAFIHEQKAAMVLMNVGFKQIVEVDGSGGFVGSDEG